MPWLQIDADGMTRGEMLGRLLCVGPDGGIGLALRLWRWALEMSPDGDFSGGKHCIRNVAAAVGWAPDDAVKLAVELCSVGLAEMPVDSGHLRIKGLERYKTAWTKNQRRRPDGDRPVTGRNPTGTGPEPERKTETETETERETLRISAGSESPAGLLDLVPAPKPKKPPKPEKPTDPRHAPMVAALVEVYEEETRGSRYAFTGRDAKAVTALLALSDDDEEIRFKWSTALAKSLDQFHTPKTRTIPELVRDWNHYTAIKGGEREECRL